jgi:hypothetical protein
MPASLVARLGIVAHKCVPLCPTSSIDVTLQNMHKSPAVSVVHSYYLVSVALLQLLL